MKLDKLDLVGIAIGAIIGMASLAICLWPIWMIASL